MSHITQIQTQICEKRFLLKALEDLGFEYIDEKKQEIKGFCNKREPVDIRVPLHLSCDIGFRKKKGVYQIVADWAGVVGVDKEDFIQKVQQRYAYHATISQLESQGFSLVSEESGVQGQIHLVLRRLS